MEERGAHYRRGYDGELFRIIAAEVIEAVHHTSGDAQCLPGANLDGRSVNGPGKDALQAQCTKCHVLGLIANSGGFNEQGWDELIGTMVSLPASQKSEITAYLAKNFPEQPRPKPVVLPGDVKVNIREWNAPSLGSRPHDPEPGPDGSIWWTGMFANVIGHVNPKTGEIREFPLKTPGSGPHGLELDKDGNVWFTANQAAYVGKLDPKTGDGEIKMPEGVRDPHTPLFADAALFFTAQNSEHRWSHQRKNRQIKVQRTRPSAPTLRHGIHDEGRAVRVRLDGASSRSTPTLAIKEYRFQNRTAARAASPSARRRHLVRGHSRGYLTPRSEDGSGERGRSPADRVTALRHHVPQRRDLVRRIGDRRNVLVRHEDAEVPELDHPRRRRCRPQHQGNR
jgi:hypothetical protein